MMWTLQHLVEREAGGLGLTSDWVTTLCGLGKMVSFSEPQLSFSKQGVRNSQCFQTAATH